MNLDKENEFSDRKTRLKNLAASFNDWEDESYCKKPNSQIIYEKNDNDVEIFKYSNKVLYERPGSRSNSSKKKNVSNKPLFQHLYPSINNILTENNSINNTELFNLSNKSEDDFKMFKTPESMDSLSIPKNISYLNSKSNVITSKNDKLFKSPDFNLLREPINTKQPDKFQSTINPCKSDTDDTECESICELQRKPTFLKQISPAIEKPIHFSNAITPNHIKNDFTKFTEVTPQLTVSKPIVDNKLSNNKAIIEKSPIQTTNHISDQNHHIIDIESCDTNDHEMGTYEAYSDKVLKNIKESRLEDIATLSASKIVSSLKREISQSAKKMTNYTANHQEIIKNGKTPQSRPDYNVLRQAEVSALRNRWEKVSQSPTIIKKKFDNTKHQLNSNNVSGKNKIKLPKENIESPTKILKKDDEYLKEIDNAQNFDNVNIPNHNIMDITIQDFECSDSDFDPKSLDNKKSDNEDMEDNKDINAKNLKHKKCHQTYDENDPPAPNEITMLLNDDLNLSLRLSDLHKIADEFETPSKKIPTVVIKEKIKDSGSNTKLKPNYTPTPKKTPVNKIITYDIQNNSGDVHISSLSPICQMNKEMSQNANTIPNTKLKTYNQRIKELMSELEQQQTIIAQISQALLLYRTTSIGPFRTMLNGSGNKGAHTTSHMKILSFFGSNNNNYSNSNQNQQNVDSPISSLSLNQEQLEAEKLNFIARQKRQMLITEIEKLKKEENAVVAKLRKDFNYRPLITSDGMESAYIVNDSSLQGSSDTILTINNIKLILKPDFIGRLINEQQRIHHNSPIKLTYYILCLFKYGSQLAFTNLTPLIMAPSQSLTSSSKTLAQNYNNLGNQRQTPQVKCVNIAGNIVLKGIQSGGDWLIESEVYCLYTKCNADTNRENTSTTPHFSTSLMNKLTPSKKKLHFYNQAISNLNNRKDADVVEENFSDAGIFVPNGFITLSKQDYLSGNRSFILKKVPQLSPLQGTMFLQMKTVTQTQYKGFLNMFEVKNGINAWERRWFVLSGQHLSWWKYPEEEILKTSLGSIDLSTCINRDAIKPLPLETCALPNTFEMIVYKTSFCEQSVVHPSDLDVAYNIHNDTNQNSNIIHKHLFSADNKEQMNGWLDVLNKVLSDLNLCIAPNGSQFGRGMYVSTIFHKNNIAFGKRTPV